MVRTGWWDPSDLRPVDCIFSTSIGVPQIEGAEKLDAWDTYGRGTAMGVDSEVRLPGLIPEPARTDCDLGQVAGPF